jgi:hypothetical protein
MPSSWISPFVILLSLALLNGNAHAALHLGAAHSEPCPEEHEHSGGTHHQITITSPTRALRAVATA